MSASYAYKSGQAEVVCKTVPLSDGRYCGKFTSTCTTADGRREIHERTCPGWYHSLADALICARAMAESLYPPTPPHET